MPEKRRSATRFPDFFVFRTPALAFDEFVQWSGALDAPSALDDSRRLSEALESDRKHIRERLCAIAARPDVREALFLASVPLESALERWVRDPDSKKGRRIERALVRYFSRMCGRATPFGLFAGHSVGERGATTRLELKPRSHYRRHVRLDMDYLTSLTESLAAADALQAVLRFRPNTSLHRNAGRLQYAESRREARGRRYHLVAVDETDYLLETLRRAEDGATLNALTTALVEDDVTYDDASAYIRELVRCQLLVPDLNPRATGSEPTRDLIAQLHDHADTVHVASVLDGVQQELEAIEQEPPGIAPAIYRTIAERLGALSGGSGPEVPFQVDLAKPAAYATLGDDVLEEVARAVGLLHGLRPDPEDALSLFRDRFRARYENREVSLLDALDEESGVGFGAGRNHERDATPLLEGLAVPRGPREVRDDAPSSGGALDALLLRKLQEVSASGGLIMALDAEEIERCKISKPKPLPEALSVVAKLAADSPEALALGHFKLLISYMTGPSGAVLLGRFCHGDEALLDHVQRLISREESARPDIAFAEIVHLPEGRAGNVILRPRFRHYEIPFLGRSAVPDEQQIPISDLVISLRGDEIVLRSTKLGKEIAPRLTCAHNFRASSLPVYRFLCSLQSQGTARLLGWSWGSLEKAPFLPRVVVGKIVLTRARWRVERDELKAMSAKQLSEAEWYRLVQEWRRSRRIPRVVVLVDGDNQLPFDLDNVSSVDTFIELVKTRHEIRLDELYPGPDELCVVGAEGRFVHELVVPILNERPQEPRKTLPDIRETNSLRRSFPPGSQWLYAKLYTGTAGADHLLRDVVTPLVRQAMSERTADRWFFIRYADPDWHLRVRFHGVAERLMNEILPELSRRCEPYLANGLLWKMQLDTYEREVERYGGSEGVSLAEALFQADSEATLVILESFDGEMLSDLRWRLALRGMDQLFDDFEFTLDERCRILARSRELWRDEPYGRELDHQIGERFRRERATLDSILDRDRDATSDFRDALHAFARRSENIQPIVSELRRLEQRRALLEPRERLVVSYLHMHANRLLRSVQNAQEVVLYELLGRIYDSRRARQRKLQEVCP